MQQVTLLLLAGGMGSRFGGDKQLTTIGTTKKTLLHFSILDAYQAGVRQVVLVIRPDLTALFESQVLPGLPTDLQVQLVAQQLDAVPSGLGNVSAARQKPWGTAHAVWVASAYLTQPFIVINADDYYGADAMRQLVAHFAYSKHWAMVAYPLRQTLSLHGGVNRGLCRVEDGLLQAVEECTGITEKSDGQYQGFDSTQHPLALDGDTLVSMNIWGFTPQVLVTLEQALRQFLAATPAPNAECYLPATVDDAIAQGQPLQVYQSADTWYGMTYQADLALLVDVFADK